MIAKQEAKSFIEQIKGKKEEQRLTQNSSLTSAVLQTVQTQERSTPAVRYGQAPSSIEAIVKPPLQSINEVKPQRPVDRSENSLKDKDQQLGLSSTFEVKRVDIREKPAAVQDANVPIYAQLKKEYQERAPQDSVGKQFNVRA